MFQIMRKKTIIFLLIIVAGVGGFFYFRSQVYFSHGSFVEKKVFEIAKGDGSSEIAGRLKKEGLISGEWYFHYYVRMHDLADRFLPGEYELSGNMTIPEIAVYMTEEKNIMPGYEKITFPEGWTIKKMAERLDSNGLDGQGFLRIAQDPQGLEKDYEFLKGVGSLEGYMFPDTYFFKKDIQAQDIVRKILDNFDRKLVLEMRDEIRRQNKSIGEIIIMASLIEKEVQTEDDQALVSGIFWNRIAIGQPLQSDSPLTYILDNKTDQHSRKKKKIDSPYNTYVNKRFLIESISNPVLSAIKVTIYTKKTDFFYFFTVGGKTIFSKTFEEHVANRAKYGI